MDSITDFFDALTDQRTWMRVAYVIFGAVLIYLALTAEPINRFGV